MEHIVYKWLDTPVQFEKKLELPQFRLVNFTLEDCSQNYTTGEDRTFYLIFNILCINRLLTDRKTGVLLWGRLSYFRIVLSNITPIIYKQEVVVIFSVIY